MMHSDKIFITTVIGGVSIIAWVVGGWIDRNTAQLLLGVLFGSFVGIAIAAVALAASQAKSTRTRYVERETPQTSVEPQKRLAESTTRYTVVTQPSARLRQPASAIGTTARQQIEVRNGK